MMKYEFDYCVYNQNFECYLDEVGINTPGMCKAYTLVSVQEKQLERYKKAQLREIMSRYEDFDE